MKALWIVWCACWAFFWATIGWVIFPFGNILLFILSCVLMLPVMLREKT